MSKHILLSILTILLFLQQNQIQAVTTCSSSTLETFYDGYLDNNIYSGYFDSTQNAFFKFKNPFQGISSLSSATIAFWAKIPLNQTSGSFQSGSIMDCTDSAKIRSSSGNITYYVQQPSNGQSATITSSYQSQVSNWNHFAFTFLSSNLTIYMNGVLQITYKFSTTTIGSTSATCTVGNSQTLGDPLNFYMRHLLFQKYGWQPTAVSTLMHNINLPTDLYTLAYFQFQRNYNFNSETYFTNSTRAFNSSGVSIVATAQPEFVCYCTGTTSNFLQISQNFTLYPINMTALTSVAVDTNGFIIDAMIYASPPKQSSTASSDVLLFNLTNYAYLYLTNNTNTLRLDVFKTTDTTTPSQSFTFKTFRFRFHYWTLISIAMTKTTATLSIDGVSYEKQTSTNTFQKSSSQFIINLVNSYTQISYLAHYIALRNYNSKVIFNYTLAESYFNYNATTSVSNGTLEFISNNKLCTSNETISQTYWNGNSCTDRRLVPQFSNSEGLLKSYLMSSKSNMTIQIWIKDFLNASTIQSQVILENSADGVAPLIQIGIITGISQSSSRQLYCMPNVISSTQVSVTATTQSIWNHFSCISNNYNNSLTAIVYNQNTDSSTYSSVSSLAFSDFSNSKLLLTTLGRKVDSSLPFVGMLRDLRIWSVPLTFQQVNIQRFQVTRDTTNMLHYFMLSDQINPHDIKSSGVPEYSFVEQTFNSSEVSYQTDTSLVICQDGYIYNGNCCQLYNLSATTFSITQTQKNLIKVSIDESSVGSDYIYSYLHAGFTLISVGNNFNVTAFGTVTSYLTYMQSYFNQSEKLSYSVNAALINPLVYSFTVQAFIYSDLDSTQNFTLTKTFVLTCPAIFMSTHPIIGSTEETQIVSLNTTDTAPRIYTTNYLQCYTVKTSATTTNTFSGISYSINNTNVKYASLFTTSKDLTTSYSIANKASVLSKPAYYNLNITAQLNKSTTIRYDYNYILLYYEPITISMGSVSSTIYQKLLYGDLITVDLTSMSVNGNSSVSLLTYNMVCPEGLFSSLASYNSLCQIPSTGIVSMNTSDLKIIANVNYTFTLYVTVTGTSIYQNVSLTVQFYKDGGQTNCPKVVLSTSYSYDIYNPTTLQIMSDPYLYCSGTYYNIKQFSWSLTDSLKPTTNLTSTLLSFGTQTILSYANITSTSISSILPGQILNLAVTMNATASSQSAGTVFSSIATSTVTFTQTPLNVRILAYSYNKTQISNQNVSFLEEKLYLNATNSYDPDNTSAVLTYSWTCPSIVSQYYSCQALTSADGKTLSLNAIQRAKIGFLYNTQYNFSVTATSTVNPYKAAITQTLPVTFSAPTNLDYKLNALNSTCDQFYANSSLMYYINATYPRVIKYDISNFTNVFANITANSSVSCKNGSINEQVMYMYIQNFKEFSSNQPIYYILEQNFSQGNLQQNFTTSFNFTNNFNMQYSNYDFMQVQVYWFTQRFTSTDYVFMAVDYFYLYRTKAPLVASLNIQSITVDKYDSFTLSAVGSVDLEGLNLNYSYIWICPNSVSVCAVTTGPILTVSADTRYLGSANTNGQSYKYSVIMTDGSRNSSTVSATVIITMKSSYASCLTLSLETDNLNSYQSSSNNTLFIQYNQTVPTNLSYTVNSTSDCPGSVTLQKSYFTTYDTTESQFWLLKSSSNILIQQTNLPTIVSYQYYPGQLSTIIFTQFFSIGLDTVTQQSTQTYINVNLTLPNLLWNVNANKITTFDSVTKSMSFSATLSSDPVNYRALTYQWSCPSYFSSICSSSTLTQSVLTLNSIDLISSYYNMSHEFSLTIATVDQVRSTTKSFFVYLADPVNGPFNTSSEYSNCGIYIYNSTETILNIWKTQAFYFYCPGNLQSNLIGNDTLTWSIDGLTLNQDYYVVDNHLYMKPLRFQQLSTSQVIVSVVLPSISLLPFKQAFDYANNQLMPSSSISFSPSTVYKAYSQNYSMTFTNIQSVYNYGIQVQLRGYLNAYTSKQIILPVMPLNEITQTVFFDSLTLHQTSSLFVDVFDMNYNYMDSYDMTMAALSLGSFTQANFEGVLNLIVDNTASSYVNTTEGRYQYISDMDKIQQYSEIILSSSIITYTSDSKTTQQKYALSIIQYLVNTYLTNINYFYVQANHTHQIQARITLNRKVIFTLSNCIQTGLNYTSLLSDVVDILQQIQADFSLMTQYQDDYQILRSSLIYILSTSQSQIFLLPAQIEDAEMGISITNSEILTLGDQITALQEWIIGQDFSTTKGQLKYTLVGQTSKATLYLNEQNTNGATFENQIISSETVYLSNQEKLSEYAVDYLEVSYNLQDNITSPATSQVFINAYNSSFQIKEIYLDSISSSSSLLQYISKKRQFLTDTSSGAVIFITMQVNDQYKQKFQDLLSDNSSSTYYAPRCVYFDSVSQLWTDSGVQNISYNADTGVLNCSITYLSQYTLDYLVLSKPSIIGNNTNSTNSTSAFNTGQVPIYVYYLAVAVPSFITLITIGLSCLSPTQWQGGDPKVQKMRRGSYSCFAIFRATCGLHHLLISAIFSREKASIHLTIPKYSKMIDFWWLFYAVYAGLGLGFYFTSGYQEAFWYDMFDKELLTVDWSADRYINLVYLGQFALGVLLVGRIIVLSFGYLFYFCNKKMSKTNMRGKDIYNDDDMFLPGLNSDRKDNDTDRTTDLEDNLLGKKQKAKKGKKKKKKKTRSKQLREEHNFEMEGGSSDEEVQKYKQAVRRQHKPRSGNSQQRASKERTIQSSSYNNTYTKNRSSNEQDQETNIVKKSRGGNRYDQYEQKEYSANRVNKRNESKNIADIIDSMEDPVSSSANRVKKSQNRYKVNESNFKASGSAETSSRPKKYERRQDSPEQHLRNQKYSNNDSLENQRVHKNYKGDEEDQEYERQTFGKKKGSNSREKINMKSVERSKTNDKQSLFVEDSNFNQRSGKPQRDEAWRNSKGSAISTIYKPTTKKYQDETLEEEYKERPSSQNRTNIKRTRNASPAEDHRTNSSLTSVYKNQQQTQNYKIQNQSTRINSSIDSFYDMDDRSTEKKSKNQSRSQSHYNDYDKADNFDDIAQYKKCQIIMAVIKAVLMMGCMAVTFWTMWLFADWTHLYYWLIVGGYVLLAMIIVVEPLFIAIFSLLFMCAGGNETCIRIAATILLGNGHRNVINGIFYELNAKN